MALKNSVSCTQRQVEGPCYLNVSVRSSAGTLLCDSNCPFSVCLVVPSLFFISSEDWLSFKERIDEKFFKSVLKELETSSLRDAEAGLEIAVTQFNPQKP